MKKYAAILALIIPLILSSCAGLGMGIVDVDSSAPVGPYYWSGNGYINNPYWGSPIYGTPPPPPPAIAAPVPRPPQHYPSRPPQNPTPGPSQGGFNPSPGANTRPAQGGNPGTNATPPITSGGSSQPSGGLVGGRR